MFTASRQDLDRLVGILHQRGYTVIGPKVKDGAIVYSELGGLDELPIGWTDDQNAGSYRLRRTEDDKLFNYNVGPYAWKRYLFPPVQTILQRRRGQGDGDEQTDLGSERIEPLAFFGVRPCELQAFAVHDRVFLGGTFVDESYRRRRKQMFVVAVNCGKAGGTCFCASLGTGPRAKEGFDLSLTEVKNGANHHFTVETGSRVGEEVAALMRSPPSSPDECALSESVTEKARASMGRSIETRGLKEILERNFDHARWEQTAARCLTCANCTMVCPTCFCSTVEDTTDLTGAEAKRVRRWDSCFTLAFSYIHGGSIRSTVVSRYRQWMMHKFATWIDQFGMTGCVGCGRCITWCPVGIDITEEARSIRESDARNTHAPKEVLHGES